MDSPLRGRCRREGFLTPQPRGRREPRPPVMVAWLQVTQSGKLKQGRCATWTQRGDRNLWGAGSRWRWVTGSKEPVQTPLEPAGSFGPPRRQGRVQAQHRAVAAAALPPAPCGHIPGCGWGLGDPRRGLAASSPLHARVLLRPALGSAGPQLTPPCSEGTWAGLKGHGVATATLERAPSLQPAEHEPLRHTRRLSPFRGSPGAERPAASRAQNPPPLPAPVTGMGAASPGPTC